MATRRDRTDELGFTLAALADIPCAALLLRGAEAALPANGKGRALLAEATPPLRAALEVLHEATLADGRARTASLSPLPGREALLLPLADGQTVLALIRDAALERNLREALIESRQRYKDLVEISSDFAWETNAEGRFVFVSPKGVLGWSPSDLLDHDATEFLAEPGEANAFATAAPVADGEVWFRRPDGGAARLGIVAAPLQGGGARGLGRDLTAERERADALAHALLRDRLFTHLVRAIRDEIVPEAALAAAASATGLALGAAGAVILRRVEGDLAPTTSWGEMAGAATLDASRAAFAEADAIALGNGDWQVIGHVARYRQQVEGAILLWRRHEDGGFPEGDRALLGDVADQLGVAIAQVAQHERVVTLSRTDPLTGLLNRRAFFDELERRLRRLDRDARAAVLLYVDMDNFKLVNDRRGHRVGDEAIQALVALLRTGSRGGDLLARLGGDEFAIWIDGLGARAALERAEALLRASRALAPFTGDPARPLGISIGLALVEPGHGELPEQLVARADAAMYRAKAAGKGGIAVALPAGTVPA